jgi:glycosyltransferase involved in cell wall biosynthesis
MTSKPEKPIIAIDIQSTFAQKTGIGVYTNYLVQNLAEVAPEFTYALIRPPKVSDDYSVPERWRWDQLGFPSRARRSHAHLLHQPGFSAPLLTRAKVVVTVHDSIARLFGSDIPYWSRQYFARWMPFTYAHADHILADSEHTKKDLIREVGVPEEKITVVYLAAGAEYGINTDQTKLEEIRHKYQIPRPYLLHLGTINPRKNLEFLVRVFSAIAHEFPRLSLVISGKKGWYYDRLFELVENLGLRERVIFTGYVADEDKPALLAGAEICPFPSLYEGFGLPPLEAMASGIPVISSNSSSLPEVIGGAGILLDPRDEAGWVEALRLVLKSSTRRRELREKGLAQAKRFSWEKTARETADVYRAVLGKI